MTKPVFPITVSEQTMSYLNLGSSQCKPSLIRKYDYWYTKGKPCDWDVRSGSRFFNSQQEINKFAANILRHRPGDVKYKDQNGDNRIGWKDVVKMFVSLMFHFGFNLNSPIKDSNSLPPQGMTGVTVSTWQPAFTDRLWTTETSRNTFFEREVYWTPENKSQSYYAETDYTGNQKQPQSQFIVVMIGSFLKLRNPGSLYISEIQTCFADLQVFVQGTTCSR